MTETQILLIDDDVDATMLRKRVLEPKGYRVQIALDAASRIALALGLKPALILLDHSLTPAHRAGGLAGDPKGSARDTGDLSLRL